MVTNSEAHTACTLSELLQKNKESIDYIDITHGKRPGIQASLRSVLFPHGKTGRRTVNSPELKIHAVGLNIRFICNCSGLNREGECRCFGEEDLACRALYLSKNALTNARGLDRFHYLTTLSLADNLFEYVPNELQGLVKLKRLNFAGNRLAEDTPHFRERILYYCPNLCELDGGRVTQKEISKAQRIIHEESMLKNVAFLVKTLCEAQNLGLESEFETVCKHVQQQINEKIDVSGVETLEDYMLHFHRELMMRCIVLDEDADIWHLVHLQFSDGALSWNHGLAILAGKLWNQQREINSNIYVSLEAESFAREMTSSLVLLESMLRDKGEGGSTELEGVIMTIWAQLYILVGSFETPIICQEVSCAEDVDECISIGSISETDCEDSSNPTNEMLLVLQNDNETLRHRIEIYMQRTEKLSRDKEEMTAVVSLLQENLEQMNKKKVELSEENKVLLERIKNVENERDISFQKVKELHSAHLQYQKDVSSHLKTQEKHFSESMASLLQQLDDLKKEPRIPINIEIINPDVIKIIQKKEKDLEWTQQQLNYFLMNKEYEIKADVFKHQWQNRYNQLAATRCFGSWRSYTWHSKSLDVFRNNLQAVSRHRYAEAMLAMLSHWHKCTIRTKKIAALSVRVAERRRTDRLTIIIQIWVAYTHLRVRVREWVAIREQRIQARVLELLWLHKCSWQQGTREGMQVAARFYEKRLSFTSVKTWLEVYRLQHDSRESRLHEIRTAWKAKTTLAILSLWRHLNTQSQIHALGRAFSNHRLVSKSLKILMDTRQRSKNLDICHSKLSAFREQQTYRVVIQSWRAEVHSKNEVLVDICMRLWYRYLIRQRYIRCCEAKQEEKMKHMVKESICQWRARTWRSKHHEYQALKHIVDRMKVMSLVRDCFSRWRMTLLRTFIEHQNDKLEHMDRNTMLIASSCNSMKETLKNHYEDIIKATRKTSTGSYVKLDRLEKQHRAVKKRLASTMADASKMRLAICDLESTKIDQHNHIESLCQKMGNLERENHMLELRLQASETIKASVSTRASRAIKTSSMATETLLSLWDQPIHHYT